ncbi:hypothetical protein INR49_019441 [Caranx melampygus]|nr:hypothetical protein INR49_019441 [Caranx melampygus]
MCGTSSQMSLLFFLLLFIYLFLTAGDRCGASTGERKRTNMCYLSRATSWSRPETERCSWRASARFTLWLVITFMKHFPSLTDHLLEKGPECNRTRGERRDVSFSVSSSPRTQKAPSDMLVKNDL